MSETFDKVKKIIVDRLSVDESKVKETSSFIEDHHTLQKYSTIITTVNRTGK